MAAVACALNAYPGDAAVQTEGLWALLVFCKHAFNVAAVQQVAAHAASAAEEMHKDNAAVVSKAVGLAAMLSQQQQQQSK